MAEKILKNVSNQIWETTSNQIIKSRPFSETPILNGLQFWGQANPDYLTIIDGKVSEAYDVRGTGAKMIQNTVAYRPIYTNNSLYFVNGSLNLYAAGVKSMFIVMKNVSDNFNGLGISYEDINLGYNYFGKQYALYNNTTKLNLYVNNTAYIANGKSPDGLFNILHSVSDCNSTGTFNLGAQNISGWCYVKEWGWYNRVLNTGEIIYNINALNTRNQIF